ncbi:MAG TPA: S1 RNA-binding domain-containing protein [Candidatus Eisenbergiella merdavium]|uniref:S1 RNA-binding domain-containing protein n=1 Tax=Candidatus Eisenbergiella merdavium TaxID=2838551 RepID=A0A9D2NF46_9FIRM|nr:S1 RNA-binding domain-containing protein [Candidatus Eisenbergiella merdavium]
MATENNTLSLITESSAPSTTALLTDDSQSPASERMDSAPILTLSTDTTIESPQSREDTLWHELQHAYRTRKILTGHLSGMEQLEGGGTITVVYYQEMRIIIPLSEMMINLADDQKHDYGEMILRQRKILGNMLGAEIDFIVKGLDKATRSVVASRKEAMLKKRSAFYLPDASGQPRIYPGRVVQARIIAVSEKVLRVEIFGVECPIPARDLSWDWLGDVSEHFHVGETVLTRIQEVNGESQDNISVKADVKSTLPNTAVANLAKCKIQGKYAGIVTDIHKGTVFIRLHIGVNAVAHSCYDSRQPGRRDEVSFVITKIDQERNMAVGLISRIIRQGNY